LKIQVLETEKPGLCRAFSWEQTKLAAFATPFP